MDIEALRGSLRRQGNSPCHAGPCVPSSFPRLRLRHRLFNRAAAFGVVFPLCLVLAQSAHALEGAAPASGAEGQKAYRSSLILRAPVRDAQGRPLGEIHDLILAESRVRIAYAVVSSGGVIGVGKRFHAVPWSQLTPREDGRYYVLNADAVTLRRAPEFDFARWPDLADPAWRAEVNNYWSETSGSSYRVDSP